MKQFYTRKVFLVLLTCITVLFSIQLPVKADITNPSISYTIDSPKLNSTVYDDLKVIVSKPITTFQVSEVKAKVEGKEINLTYDENAGSSYNSGAGWVGNIDLRGLARGIHTLEVTVKDHYGNSLTQQRTFKYTQQPRITITSPQYSGFSSGAVRITAEATDFAGEDCTISVSAAADGLGGRTLIKSLNKVDTTVNLDSYTGREVRLYFTAANESGGVIGITKTLYIENSPYLAKKYQVNGRILDLKDDKILYQNNNEVRIKDLQTSIETLVLSDSKYIVTGGYLTPNGALLTLNEYPYYTINGLFEYKNNQLTYLGRLASFSLKVNGSYAIWNGDLKPFSSPEIGFGDELYLINVNTNDIKLISNKAAGANVTSSGDVIYLAGSGSEGDTTSNIFKYSNGTTSKLSFDNSYSYANPLSDGKVTVYVKYQKNEERYFLTLNREGKEEMLATSSNGILPGTDYVMNNDYIAYTKNVNGTKQIFIWKDGVSKQLTYFGPDSAIESLGANGDVIARFNYQYYLYKYDGSQPIKLYTLSGLKNYWITNEAYGVIDGSVVKIETNPVVVTDITLSETQLEVQIGEHGDLTANVWPSNATNQNVKWSSSNSDIATVDNSGKVTAQKTGTAVITAITEEGDKAASCTVLVPKDVIPPVKPNVNVVSNGSKSVAGTAEAGSTVRVISGKSVLGTAKTGEDGRFTIIIPRQKAGTSLSITARDSAGNVSCASVVKVLDKIGPAAPTINSVSDHTTLVSGKTEAYAVVRLYIAGKYQQRYTTGKYGTYKFTISKQNAGTVIEVTSTDKAGNVGSTRIVKVLDKTAPGAPIVNKVTYKTKYVTGKTEKEATVYVDRGKTYLGKAVVNSKDTFSVKIPPQKKGTILYVFAKDKVLNRSKIISVKVY